MSESYLPDNADRDDERLYGAAPEEDLLRLERFVPALASDLPCLHTITVQAPPTEPEARAGDQA